MWIATTEQRICLGAEVYTVWGKIAVVLEVALRAAVTRDIKWRQRWLRLRQWRRNRKIIQSRLFVRMKERQEDDPLYISRELTLRIRQTFIWREIATQRSGQRMSAVLSTLCMIWNILSYPYIFCYFPRVLFYCAFAPYFVSCSLLVCDTTLLSNSPFSLVE